jgi:hypothetical protein
MSSEKYVGLDVSSGKDLSRGSGFQRQVSNRVHPGNTSSNHSGVLGGASGNVVGDLRRKAPGPPGCMIVCPEEG